MWQQWFSPNSSMRRLAETYFDAELSSQVEFHSLAPGKLGGKALGLLLAWSILRRKLPAELRASVHIPRSYFVGSGEFMLFTAAEKTAGIMGGDAQFRKEFLSAPLSGQLLHNLRGMLDRETGTPLVVRSSSVLEDQYGAAFAGIYRTVFCPNQGSLAARLAQLEHAIKEVYLSAFSADAAGYRENRGLPGDPEEMAVLIQAVEGRVHGDLYFPDVAGVAFSRNPYCWTSRLDPKDGFLRLVWGLGTRAVQSMPGDYPRLIGLTNPQLRPEHEPDDLYHYSQHFFDAIHLKAGALETLPVARHLTDAYDGLALVSSILNEQGLQDVRTRLQPDDRPIVTFQKLLERTAFIQTIDRCLTILRDEIGDLINVEFSANMRADAAVEIGLLQCRHLAWETDTEGGLPVSEPDKIILETNRFLYSGVQRNIEYIISIDPDCYLNRLTSQQQTELAGLIGRLNETIGRNGYILLGPGRWGSMRTDLGVPVRFGDIFNARVLVEVHQSPEDLFSSTYGTHFFLDLVEAKIALLAVRREDAHNLAKEGGLGSPENLVEEYLPNLSIDPGCIRVHRLDADHRLSLTASPKRGTAMVYISGGR